MSDELAAQCLARDVSSKPVSCGESLLYLSFDYELRSVDTGTSLKANIQSSPHAGPVDMVETQGPHLPHLGFHW